MEKSGKERVFYTGTSKKRAIEIEEEGFKATKACTGNYGVWFYGVDGQSIRTEEGAIEGALSHAKYKTLDDKCDEMALIRMTLPIEDIQLDYPYYAFKTVRPENIKIISIEYIPLN